MSHVLVVGGTGMLRDVSLHLAARENVVSVVARNESDLNRLAEASARWRGSVNPVQVDYKESAALRARLGRAIETFGPVTTAVCWIHSSAPEAPYVVAESVGRGPIICRYFDILGSAAAAADPSHPSARREVVFRRLKYLSYRKVVLGTVNENGVARWLNHREISTGVIEALERDEDFYLVGEGRP